MARGFGSESREHQRSPISRWFSDHRLISFWDLPEAWNHPGSVADFAILAGAMSLDSLSADQLPIAFGQLQLVRLLDEGPGRRLFLAESPQQGGLPPQVRVLALRPPTQRASSVSMTALLVDVQRSRNLRHPAVAQTYACGVQDGVVFVVSEQVEGPTLEELVSESGPVPLQSAVAIIAQVGLALSHAHELLDAGRLTPLLHRHLSPASVIVGASGRVKLSGFGLADIVDAHAPAAAGPASALAFSSPEVLAGQSVTARSDLFSLGGLLAYSVLGSPPFVVPVGAQKAQYLASIVRRLADGQLSVKLESLTPGLGALCQRMMALDPAGRPESLAAVVEELKGLLDGAVTDDGSAGELADSAAQSTLGHQGPPSVQASDYSGLGGSAAPGPGRASQEASPSLPDMPPATRPDGSVAKVPRTIDPSRPLTLTRPPPSWATEVDQEDADTDDAPMMVQPTAQPIPNPEFAPTDRMSSLHYQQASGASKAAPMPQPLPIGPAAGVPASLPREPAPSQQPTDGPGRPMARRPSRKKQGTSLVPILLLMVIVVFATLAVLGALVWVQMDDDAQDPSGDKTVPSAVAGQVQVLDERAERQRSPESAAVDPKMGASKQPVAATEPADVSEDEEERRSSRRDAARDEEVRREAPRSSREPGVATGSAEELAIRHRPRSTGTSGASDLITVTVTGPADTQVQVYAGPQGGPFKSTRLKRRGVGRWEGWLNFNVPSGGVLEYWVVASHSDASSPAYSGSGSNPHQVQVR